MNPINNNKQTVDLNIFSLSFISGSQEKRFREAYFIKSLFIFRIALVAVALLYVLFGYFDKAVSPEFGNQFLFIRWVIVIPIFLFTITLSFTSFFKKVWQVIVAICFYVGGAGIIYMLTKEPDNMLYYGGLFLVFSAGFFLIKLRFFAATITSIAVLITYNICFHSIDEIPNITYILISNSFYLSSIIIGAFALYSSEIILISFITLSIFSRRTS